MKYKEFFLRHWLKALISILVLSFILLVWPTPYRYDHIAYIGSRLPVRINRITGVAEVLRMSGWSQMEETTTPTYYVVPEQAPMSSSRN